MARSKERFSDRPREITIGLAGNAWGEIYHACSPGFGDTSETCAVGKIPIPASQNRFQAWWIRWPEKKAACLEVATIGVGIILNIVSFVASLTVQKLVLALIFLGGVIAAPFITNEFLAGNYLPLVAILSLLGAVFFLSFVGRNCWVLMPAFLGLSGKLNFLPANLSMLETATIISLLFLLYDTIYKKNLRLSLGPSWIWIPSLLFLGIIFYHWAKSGDIGLRILGGETYGGRKNWTLFIGFLSMPVLYSMVKQGDPLLRWVPFFYFLAVVADFIPFVLTTVLPPAAPFVYRIYSSVNLDAFQDTLYGSFGGVDIVRVGSVGFFAMAAQLCMLAYFPAREWLRPKNWWCFPASLLCLLTCAFSGFRSYLFRYAVIWLVGGFSASRWVVLLFAPMAAFVIFVLVAGHGTLFHLPLAMQRALSPFPGKWDAVATQSAEGSSNWRETMRKVYWREYADKAGWFGAGMTYSRGLTQEGIEEFYLKLQRMPFENEEADARRFIERRQPHEGLLDVHYPTGWVGTFLLVVLLSACTFFVVKNIYITPKEQMSPDRVWVTALVLTETLSYFTVYGDLSTALPRLFILMPLAVRAFAAPGKAPAEMPAAQGASPGPAYAHAS
jgi:hypothetical protein